MLLLMKFVYARFMQGKSFQSEKLRILPVCFTAVWIGNKTKSPALRRGIGVSLSNYLFLVRFHLWCFALNGSRGGFPALPFA